MFEYPCLSLFLLHLAWIGAFAIGLTLFFSRLFVFPRNGLGTALSLALFFPCFVFTVQSTAVFLVGRILPSQIFWIFPIVGAGWTVRRVFSGRWKYPLAEFGMERGILTGLFLVLAWVVWSTPFPEVFNGHHHYIVALVWGLLRNPTFPLIPAADICYDNYTTIWPPIYSFVGAAWALPEIIGGIRPFFLFPTVCFLAFANLIGSIKEKPLFERWAPLVTIGGSYYIASTFTDLTFDTLTPVWQAFLILPLFQRGTAFIENRRIGMLVTAWVAVIAFTVRPHAFLVTAVFGSTGACLLGPTRKISFFTSSPHDVFPNAKSPAFNWFRIVVLSGLIIGALSWDLVRFRSYQNPFAPHKIPSFFSQKTVPTEISEQPPPKRTLYLKRFFLSEPTHPSTGSYIKSMLVGLAFPVWILAAFVLWGVLLSSVRPFLLAWLLAGAAGIYLVGNYPKLPSFLAVPLTCSLFWGADLRSDGWWRRGRPVMMILTALGAAMGFLLFFYNQSGHRPKTEAWTVARCFFARSCTPLDRLNHRTGGAFTDMDLAEFQKLAKEPPSSVLLSDHEPSAALPSMAGVRLWETRWYSQSRVSELWQAQTKDSLRRALDRLGIRWIQFPGRHHDKLEDSILLKMLRSKGETGQGIISVEKLFA